MNYCLKILAFLCKVRSWLKSTPDIWGERMSIFWFLYFFQDIATVMCRINSFELTHAQSKLFHINICMHFCFNYQKSTFLLCTFFTFHLKFMPCPSTCPKLLSIVSTNPLLICTWILKFLVWKIKFFELYFSLFWIGFLQATQAVKINFKLDKKSSSSNLLFQTRNFKIQVQINMG